MRNDMAAAEFERRLETARREGVEGRQELLKKLAHMPIDKVIALPASSLALLGPRGLAQLAAMREGLAGVARRPVTVHARPQSQQGDSARPFRKRRPVRSALMIVGAILAIGLAADLARPFLVLALLDPGLRSRDTSLWAACPRLDVHVDGCVYTSGGGTLSLDHVRALTGIPVDQVIGVNRHLSVRPNTVLPRGSRIVIWRGRHKLTGAMQ